MNENNPEKEYLETVATLGKGLFRDFLSEITRKRQSALLISSTITLLLSFTIVTPTESNILGIKFSVSNTQILPFLAGFISLYFLLLYITGVMQDWEYANCVEMPLQTEVFINKNKISEDWALSLLDTTRLSANTLVRYSEISKVVQDNLNKIDDLENETTNTYYQMKEQGKSEQEIDEFIEKRTKELHAIRSQSLQKHEQAKTENTKERETIRNQFKQRDLLKEKLNILVKIYSRYKTWRNIVIGLEVVFPVFLGTAALFTVFWLYIL